MLQPAQEAMSTGKGALSPRPAAETHIQSPRDKFLMDVGAWAGNVSTSVLIVFVNKVLLKNYAYHYATTLVRARSPMASRQGSGRALNWGKLLAVIGSSSSGSLSSVVCSTTHPGNVQTALHFLVCSISIWFAQKGGMIKQTTMPFNGARCCCTLPKRTCLGGCIELDALQPVPAYRTSAARRARRVLPNSCWASRLTAQRGNVHSTGRPCTQQQPAPARRPRLQTSCSSRSSPTSPSSPSTCPSCSTPSPSTRCAQGARTGAEGGH